MILHNSLLRQLKKLKLDPDKPPVKSEDWKNFLDFVNNSYMESDQDRYLIERSLEISSKETAELNERLLTSAKKAGMSEVASAVIHNIGNVLNSANISITMMCENLNHVQTAELKAIADLLQQHMSSIDDYLTKDPQGKLLPQYLAELSKALNQCHEIIYNELNSLAKNINHIKDIINTQQALTTKTKVMQEILAEELVNDALKITSISFSAKGIAIKKDIDPKLIITTDKTTLYQILVNLIHNAKEAVLESPSTDKEIVITAKRTEDNQAKITVTDNGIGIPQENLTRIFAFGFTTKKKGHGIGLHSCALAAKELGGALSAESQGVGKGSTFTLTLPL